MKELRETVFWLELIQQAPLMCLELDPLILEASELTAILGASIRTARRRETEGQ